MNEFVNLREKLRFQDKAVPTYHLYCQYLDRFLRQTADEFSECRLKEINHNFFLNNVSYAPESDELDWYYYKS